MSEVRDEYKMTELGEIPGNWKVVRQGEISSFYNGRAYKQTEFKTSGTPIIRIQNLTGERTPVYSDLELEENKYAESGDLLYAWSATFGPYIWNGPRSIYHYHIWKIDIDSNVLDKMFYYYRLDFVSKELQGKKNGFSFVHITKGLMESHQIALPTLTEQQKIASILSTVDEQIDETEQLIVKTMELKKGLMQQLLTKGIGHTEFKQTEMGEIPVQWNIFKFKNLVEAIDGDRGKNYPSNEDFSQTGYCMFLSAQNITKLGFDFANTKWISKEKHESLNSGIVKKNDLVLTSRGSKLGRIALFEDEDKYPVVRINSSMLILRMQDIKYNGKYLAYFLQGIFLPEYLKKAKVGSAQPHITKKDLNAQNIILPPLEEQQKIASILSTVNDQIEVYEQEKVKYEELKKGLMQQLLTGRIQVKI